MGGALSAGFDYNAALLNDTARSYTVALDEEPEEGYGVPRCMPAVVEHGHPDTYGTARTLWDMFNLGLAQFPQKDFLAARRYTVQEGPYPERTPEQVKKLRKGYVPSGYVERPDGSVLRGDYVGLNFAEANAAALALARGLIAGGHTEAGKTVGIFCVNRPEWTIASLACYSHSLTVVSLYATLGANAIEYIIEHGETGVVVVSKENLPALLTVLKQTPAVAQTLKTVVFIDAILDGRFGNTLDKPAEADTAAFAAAGVQLVTMSSLIAAGSAADAEGKVVRREAAAEDLAFLMYTSGTTGNPKGVMLTHRNVVATIAGVRALLEQNENAFQRYFSYLPLAHIFESVVQLVVWCTGGLVYFSQGDTRYLADDIKLVRPTMLPGVPRIWQKFYQRVFAIVDEMSCLKRWYVYRAYNAQCALLRAQQPIDPTYDSKIFKTMREKMGLEDCKIILNGAAPCPPYIVEFLRVLTGNAWVAQGYGMTEGSAGSAVSLADDPHIGACGPPTMVNTFRLADIPDMGYLSSNSPATGELLIMGPNTFLGYYKDEQNTADAYFVDAKGRRWLRTGDVGRWNPNGSISIIDRKKNLIKLGQGEYVALEKVEDIYGKCPAVGQLWIYGNGFKNVVVAVVVPDGAALHAFAVSKGWWSAAEIPAPVGALDAPFRAAAAALGEDAEKRAALSAWALGELRKFESGLVGFEKIKAVYVELTMDAMGQGFTEENECLTPTMKKRRKQLTDKYVPVLAQLYNEVGEPQKAGEHW